MKTYDPNEYPNSRSTMTADIVLLSVIDQELNVLLIQRQEEPFMNCWAVPGGFRQNDIDIDILSTAKRKLKDETNLDNIYLEQLYTFSKMHRDPRELHSTINIRIDSVAHVALIDSTKVKILDDKVKEVSTDVQYAKAGTNTKAIKWFKVKELPTMAFDHKEMIEMAVERVQNKITYSLVAFELIPQVFSIPELQIVIEQVLGTKLDRNNFRTKILSLDILNEEVEKRNVSKGRPASLYTLKKNSLQKIKGKSLL